MLTSKQRAVLTKLSHPIQPSVMVGKAGLRDEIIAAVEESLKAHELIKVRFVDYKEERQPISHAIAEKVHAELIRVIGNVAILYRQAENPEDRKIRF
jgi:RNA-binding protein